MSSFVISKKEYMKAAGIVAGIAAASRDFWVFDYKKNRNATKEDYKDNFATCYKYNARSVQEQYKDGSTEYDADDYTLIFEQYYKIGKTVVFRNDYKNALLHLKDFFSSALYQTEKPEYAVNMEVYFNRILSQIIDKAFPHECESWGSFDYPESVTA